LLNEHLSQTIHFAGTIFSKISATIMLVFLQWFTAFVNTVWCQACFLSQTLSVSQNLVTSRWTDVLRDNSLSGNTLLNVSRTAGNDFDTR
jgi:hypothetical protein